MRGDDFRCRLVLLSAVAIAATGCAKSRAQDERPPAIPVHVDIVRSQALPETRKYSAELRPNVDVPLSFRLGGYIVSLGGVMDPVTRRPRTIDAGDWVEAGARLATVRQSDYEANLASAASQLAQANAGAAAADDETRRAQVQLENATSTWNRAQALYADKALTRPDYENAKAHFDAAKEQVEGARKQAEARAAQIAQAQAQLSEARVQLSDTELRAPFRGTILQKRIDVGSLVAPGTPVVELGDLSMAKAVFGLPAESLGDIHVGQTLGVTLNSFPGRTFSGRVTNVSPTAEPQTRLFSVELSLENKNRELLPGMIASVALRTGALTPVIAVPFPALVTARAGSDAYNVYTVSGPGGQTVARVHRVYLDEVRDGFAAIHSDLATGDPVIVRPGNQVTDGVPVSIE